MLSGIDIRHGFIICLILSVLSSASWAEKYNIMLDELELIKSNQVEFSIALEEGKDRAMICGYCHGKDGNSIKDDVPNLAGQTTEYLLKQLYLYSTGERKNYVMQQLTRALKNEEMINMSLYFGAQNLNKQSGVSLSAKGKTIYENQCSSCHSASGHGNNELPRIAGQKQGFIVKTLDDAHKGKSQSTSTEKIAKMKAVNKTDFDVLADYIAAMP